MYLEPWMIIAIAICFGLCAFFNYRLGNVAGVKLGINGTFDFLEKRKMIRFNEDGSMETFAKVLPMNESVNI